MSRTDKKTQLLDKGMQGDEAAATGLEYITDLMIRFEMIEKRLSRFDLDKNHKDFSELVTSVRTSTVKLYINIYKYHMWVLRHYGGGTVTRFFNNVVGITDWKVLRQEMETIDKEIATKQQVLCNDIVFEMGKAVDEFDAENIRQHEITQQATKVRQISSRHICINGQS